MIWAKIVALVLGLVSWGTGQWDKYRERRSVRVEGERDQLKAERDAYAEANEVESHIDRLSPADREWLLRGQYNRKPKR